MQIELQKLNNWNPYYNLVWGGLDSPITKGEVARAIARRQFRSTPIKDGESTRGQHIQRIAYLVVNKDSNQIVIDVGVPTLNLAPEWIIYDGNHRLAAAFYRNDYTINISISGEIGYAKHLLKINSIGWKDYFLPC
jgi:hypothetical protein